MHVVAAADKISSDKVEEEEQRLMKKWVWLIFHLITKRPQSYIKQCCRLTLICLSMLYIDTHLFLRVIQAVGWHPFVDPCYRLTPICFSMLYVLINLFLHVIGWHPFVSPCYGWHSFVHMMISMCTITRMETTCMQWKHGVNACTCMHGKHPSNGQSITSHVYYNL